MRLQLGVGFNIIDATTSEFNRFGLDSITTQITKAKKLLEKCEDSLVGIKMGRNATAIIAMLALTELEIPFCFIPKTSITVDYGVHWLIREDAIIEKLNHNFLLGLPKQIAYRITTSGTTGIRKIVDVPWTSIMPNIYALKNLLEVSSNDRVLFLTSFHFDPSIVELFLSVLCGAQLIIAPDSARSDSTEFLSIFEKTQPTILQTTPAILVLFGKEILMRIFDTGSSLRILLVGGAPFPITLLSTLMREENRRVRVFNLYGITEVSCWASMQEVVVMNGDQKEEENNMSIGYPLPETQFRLSRNSELLIGGNRQCYIDGVLADEFTPTGDLAINTNGKWYICGRVDDQVKINDIRVNLTSWSEFLVKKCFVEAAHFVYYNDIFLVLFVVGNKMPDGNLEKESYLSLRPAKIFELKTMPLNQNGKVDRETLRDIIEKDIAEKSVNRFWSVVAKWNIKKTSDLQLPFRAYGVDSRNAAELVYELNCPELFPFVLSATVSIITVLMKLRGFNPKEHNKNDTNSSITVKPKTEELSVCLWKRDFGKCIDAEPKLAKINGTSILICGSYDGLIMGLNPTTGNEYWRTYLPDGVNANIAISKHFAVLGCFDSNVYVFNAVNGLLHWKFPTKGSIRTEISVDENDFVYAFSDDGKLYKLDVKEKDAIWCFQIGSTVRGAALLLDRNEFVHALILFGTFDQRIIAIDQHTALPCWETGIKGAIFGAVATHKTYLFACSASGNLYMLKLKDGTKLDEFNCKEVVFASCRVIESIDLLIISSEKGFLWLFKVYEDHFSFLTRIHIDGGAFVKSPFLCILTDSDLQTRILTMGQMSTDGKVHKLTLSFYYDKDEGISFDRVLQASQNQLCEGSFAQPELTDDSCPESKIFVASRDNFLYCFQLNF